MENNTRLSSFFLDGPDGVGKNYLVKQLQEKQLIGTLREETIDPNNKEFSYYKQFGHLLGRDERTKLLLQATERDLLYVHTHEHVFDSAQFSVFGLRTFAVRMVRDQYYSPRDMQQTFGWIEGYDCRLVLEATYEKQRELLLRRRNKHPEKLSTFDQWLIDDPQFGVHFLRAYRDVVGYFRPMILDVSHITRTEMVDQAIAMILACQTENVKEREKGARDELTALSSNDE